MSRCGLRSQGPSVRVNFPKSPKIRKKWQKWGKEAYIYAFLTIFHDFSLIFHCCPFPTHRPLSPPRTLGSDHPPPSDRDRQHAAITCSSLRIQIVIHRRHPSIMHSQPSKTLRNPRTPPPPPILLLYQPLRSGRALKKTAKPCCSCPRRGCFWGFRGRLGG